MNKKKNRHQIFHRKKNSLSRLSDYYVQIPWSHPSSQWCWSFLGSNVVTSCSFPVENGGAWATLKVAPIVVESGLSWKKKAQESYCQTKHYHRNISIWYLIWCTLLFSVFYAYYADGSETNGQTSNLTTCNPKLMKFLNWTLSGNTLVEMYM